MERFNTATIASIDGKDTMSVTLDWDGRISFDPDSAGAQFYVTAIRETLDYLERLNNLPVPIVPRDG